MGKTQAQINKENEIKLHALEEEMQRQQAAAIIDKYNSTMSAKIAAWLDDEAESWHDGIDDTRSALMLADHYYTDVLEAQEKPSLLKAVISGLITGLAVVNPEFAMIASVLQLGVSGEKEKEEKLKFSLELFQKAYEKYSEAKEQGEKIEKAERRRKANIGYLQDKLDECSETSHWVTRMHYTFKSALIDNPDVAFPQIQQAWNTAVGLSKCKVYHKGMDDQWARIFLYDMMQRYCKDYVHLKHFGPSGSPESFRASFNAFGAPIVHNISTRDAQRLVASGDGDDIEFEGLEPEKRKVMYEYFKDIDARYLGSRAEIRDDGNGWKDLINNWQFAA